MEGPRPPFFSCIFKMFLYDPNPFNRPLSVVIIIQLGFKLFSISELSFFKTYFVLTIIIYLTNRFHVAVRLFSNRSQMTSKCGKNK